METITGVWGVDVAELGVTQLHKQAFLDVDLELYPPQREHFLIHALQFQTKLPSEVSMLRSERRNQRKSGALEADKKVGRPSRVINPRRGGVRGGRGGRRGGFELSEKVLPKPTRVRGRWYPGYHPRTTTTKKARVAHKPKSSAFKISSPEGVVLKCARADCKASLEKWRKEKPPTIETVLDVTPEYFRKKKANQKRRRLEKHNLIKKNRRALIEIYGSAIFQRGWPVSRKEIREALGIKEQDHLAKSLEAQTLADLVQQP